MATVRHVRAVLTTACGGGRRAVHCLPAPPPFAPLARHAGRSSGGGGSRPGCLQCRAMSGPALPRGGDPHFREAMRTLKKLLPPVGAGKAKARLESPVEPISPSERARQAQLVGEAGRADQADQADLAEAEARARAEAQARLPAPPVPAIGSGGALDGRSLSTRQRRLVKHVEELLEEALAQSAQGFAVEIKEVSVSRDSRQVLVWWQYDPDAMDGARRGGFLGTGAEGNAATGSQEEALIPSVSPFDPAHDEPAKASTGAWVRPPEATEEEKLMGMWLELLEPQLRRDLASRVRLKYTPRVVFRLDLASAHADYVGSVLDMTDLSLSTEGGSEHGPVDAAGPRMRQ